MRKMYVGSRIRRLREDRGLTQAALAKVLELSPSYVNQLENDLRPMTVPVLLRLNSSFDLDMAFFASDTDARLAADLHDVFAEAAESEALSATEIEELISRMPTAGRTLVTLHRRLHAATEQLERFESHAAAPASSGAERAPMPYEDVRDFFYDRRNHIPRLDVAAEEMFASHGLTVGGLDLQLAQLLRTEHDVAVRLRADDPRALGPKRAFDADQRILTLARRLTPGQRAYQLATQLAFLTQERAIAEIVADAESMPAESRALARVGLANYFAGALILPYTQFLDAAEELRYDIDLLSLKFEVGFETICHRLSTLQRAGQRGVPFFFVRTDRAGNISKRQSATAFHFSRVGGSCPLWVVHEAFSSPGRILTQVAQMPDGREYLWISRTTHDGGLGYQAPERNFAVGLGCDLGYAGKLAYSRGLQLADQGSAVPIGAGCKVCDRPACPQRAFPQLGRTVHIDEARSSYLPYPHNGGSPGTTTMG